MVEFEVVAAGAVITVVALLSVLPFQQVSRESRSVRTVAVFCSDRRAPILDVMTFTFRLPRENSCAVSCALGRVLFRDLRDFTHGRGALLIQFLSTFWHTAATGKWMWDSAKWKSF